MAAFCGLILGPRHSWGEMAPFLSVGIAKPDQSLKMFQITAALAVVFIRTPLGVSSVLGRICDRYVCVILDHSVQSRKISELLQNCRLHGITFCLWSLLAMEFVASMSS